MTSVWATNSLLWPFVRSLFSALSREGEQQTKPREDPPPLPPHYLGVQRRKSDFIIYMYVCSLTHSLNPISQQIGRLGFQFERINGNEATKELEFHRHCFKAEEFAIKKRNLLNKHERYPTAGSTFFFFILFLLSALHRDILYGINSLLSSQLFFLFINSQVSLLEYI